MDGDALAGDDDIRPQSLNDGGAAHLIDRWHCPPDLAPPWPVPVDLACCLVTPGAADAAVAGLDDAERERANTFRRVEDQHRFIVGRAALRTALARAAGCDPASLTFAAGPHGKPIETGAASGLAFNVAHSGDYALVAVTHAHAIGVDIEAIRDEVDLLALSKRVFTPVERDRIERAPPGERTAQFFRQWVRKEAVLKGLGVGLTIEPHTVETPPTGSDWIVRDLAAPPGYAAALALLV